MALVTVSDDLCVVVPLSATPHKGPLGMCPTVEAPTPMLWRPGFGMGQNKLSRKVRHLGKTIVLDRHDVGAFIPHLSVPPNPANVMQTAMSSRKAIFASSKVLIEGKRVAACLSHAGWHTPMNACADPVSLPIAVPVTACANSATFGMTLGDVLAGVAEMLIDVVAAAADIETIAGPLAKAAAGALSGAIRMAATEGESAVDLSFGSPFLSISIGLKRNAKGELSAAAGGRALGFEGELAASPDRRGVESRTSWWTESEDGAWTQHESVDHHQRTSDEAWSHRSVRETNTEWGNNPLWGEPLSSTTTPGAAP